MVKRSAASSFLFPFSGDVAQAINPWTWWLRLMGQIGFININLTKSSDSALEQRIIENVAGYGRQLGRTIEVLEALLAHADRTAWTAAQKKALEDFVELATEIAAEKGAFIAPTSANVDRFLEGLRHLRESDRKRYDAIIQRLIGELST